jgi:predicted naringenin-chalcone synthase
MPRSPPGFFSKIKELVMQAALLGIGTATPPLRISRSESVAAATTLCAEDEDHAELLLSLYRQSGIESRHVVYRSDEFRYIVHGEGECDSPFIPEGKGARGPSTGDRMERYETEAIPLALEASRAAIGRSGVDAGTISHLVSVSCTGMAAPGVDLALMRELGLRPTVERTNVGFMGCHGSLNGLRVARGLIAAEPNARVLLCSVELCSLHYWYGWNPKKMVGNALFADGAAAVVLGRESSPVKDTSGQMSPEHWQLAANGACVFPGSEEAMAWLIRDHGFEMVLSTRVPGLIRQNLQPWLESWLARHGLTVGEIASWAVHPGGPRVLSCVEEALGLANGATEVSRSVLARYGNMSSATVLFILEELARTGAARPCVALGFGPGLAAEAALFR